MHSVAVNLNRTFFHNYKSITDSFQHSPTHLSRRTNILITATTSSSLMTSPPPLPRRSLGQTGLEVSVLGFGASPLGGVFQVKFLICLFVSNTRFRSFGDLSYTSC